MCLYVYVHIYAYNSYVYVYIRINTSADFCVPVYNIQNWCICILYRHEVEKQDGVQQLKEKPGPRLRTSRGMFGLHLQEVTHKVAGAISSLGLRLGRKTLSYN